MNGILSVIPTIGAVPLTQVLGLRENLEEAGLNPTIVSNSMSLSRALRESQIPYTTSECNAGFGASVGLVAGNCDWSWLLIVNDDICLGRSACRTISRNLSSHDGTVEERIVTFGESRLRPIPGPRSVFLDLSLVGKTFRRLMYRTRTAPRRSYVSFDCVAVSRATWSRVGGFDSRMIFTYEDADFVRRARCSSDFAIETLDVPSLVKFHSVSSVAHADSVLPVSAWSGLQYLVAGGCSPRFSRALVVAALLVRVPLSTFSRTGVLKTAVGASRALKSVWSGQVPHLPLYSDL